MEPNSKDWLPGSFHRKPEWRWLRAQYLLDSRRRLDRRIDDDWVIETRRALRCRKSNQKASPILAARDLWNGEHVIRGQLEARLLTTESIVDVAKILDIPDDVVLAYSEVFFAVRPMRQATDWVLNQAIGYHATTGFTGDLLAGVWKLAAFTGGTGYLDVVLAVTTDQPLPRGFLSGADYSAYQEARLRLLVRLWVASLAARTDKDFIRVAEVRQQLHDFEALRTAASTIPTKQMAVRQMHLQTLKALSKQTKGMRQRRERTDNRPSASVPRPDTSECDAAATLDQFRQWNADLDVLIAGRERCKNNVPFLQSPEPERRDLTEMQRRSNLRAELTS